jgi:hypothetical protein
MYLYVQKNWIEKATQITETRQIQSREKRGLLQAHGVFRESMGENMLTHLQKLAGTIGLLDN